MDFEYDMVIPIGNRAYYLTNLTYFNFIEQNRVNEINPILDNLYNSWKNSNFTYIITKKTLPKW